MAKDLIAAALARRAGLIKTYSDLLAEGVPHQGGLKQLASAEKTGELLSTIACHSRPRGTTSKPKR